MNKEKQKRIALSKVFLTIQKGDFVEFLHGKVLWKVAWEYPNRLILRSINSGIDLSIWKEEYNRIYKLSREEALRRMCLHRPRSLNLYFSLEELISFFKSNLKR